MALTIKDLVLWTPAWQSPGQIPDRHAYDKGNVSPELRWSGVPEGTRSLAVICHDPDAPMLDGFTHWVVYNIPPEAEGIAEDGGGRFTEGVTDFGDTGYGGPMPPAGHGPHHYFFFVYALDAELGAEPGLTRRQLLERMDGHLIEMNRMVGVYEN